MLFSNPFTFNRGCRHQTHYENLFLLTITVCSSYSLHADCEMGSELAPMQPLTCMSCRRKKLSDRFRLGSRQANSAYLMRVKIQVMDNHGICCSEIDAHTARPCRDQEKEMRRIWCIEGVYVPLTLILRRITIQSKGRITFPITEVFNCPVETISKLSTFTTALIVTDVQCHHKL